jgi:hypothetical protein
MIKAVVHPDINQQINFNFVKRHERVGAALDLNRSTFPFQFDTE